jgi:F-type H+-transporting ATPase subunit gamma
MANTRELRRRIRSVKNTAQITKAMEMVSATKMRRAQNQALSGRPYSSTLYETLGRLAGKINPEMHKLLQPNESTKTGVILVTTDKSLCGALNTNIFRKVLEFTKGNVILGSAATPESSKKSIDSGQARMTKREFVFYTVGTKGRNFVVRSGHELIADFENSDLIEFRKAKQIAKLALDSFLSGELGEVYIIYPNFVSTLRQEPRVVKLLPIDQSVIASGAKQSSPELGSLHGESNNMKKIASSTASPRNDGNGDSEYLIEPSPDELLDFVLTHEVEIQIYQALLETKASEHSARMIAMQNASNNAKDLVSDLNLTYNQTRQDAITRELLEITTASLALE